MADITYWRRKAHAAFDPIWQVGPLPGRRSAAYRWLAHQMGLPVEQTHIALFNEAQCKRVIQLSEKLKGATHHGREHQEERGKDRRGPRPGAGGGDHH